MNRFDENYALASTQSLKNKISLKVVPRVPSCLAWELSRVVVSRNTLTCVDRLLCTNCGC